MRKQLGISIFLIVLLLAVITAGCSRSQREGSDQFPLEICHATGSETNQYVSMTMNSQSALNGHKKHEGDLIPAPAEGCPDNAVV